MLVALLQMMGIPMGKPVHSRAEGAGSLPASRAGEPDTRDPDHRVSVRRQEVKAIKASPSKPTKTVAKAAVKAGKPAAKAAAVAPKGVVFVTLEDETGSVDVIVWRAVKEAFHPALYCARLLAVYGVWQRDESSGGQVRHLVAKRLVDLTHLLGDLAPGSRDFH